MKNKAVFLDLDHTLIKPKSGNTFPVDADDWQLMPGIIDKLKPYVLQGHALIIVTNQGGIEAGYHTEQETVTKLESVLDEVFAELAEVDTSFELEYFYCKTNNKADPLRKPNTGMVAHAATQFRLDLGSSLFVGDMDTDRQCAEAAGVQYIDINEFLK